MKQLWSAACTAAIVAATIGVGAQAGAPAPQAGAPGQGAPGTQASAQASTPNTVTISGCIENAPASAASPAGSPAAAKYVLASAKMATTGGAVGTAGSSATTASSYQLEADEKLVSPHLNHQVEITGTVQATASASASPGGATSATAAPMLKVTAVKMVSATCTK